MIRNKIRKYKSNFMELSSIEIYNLVDIRKYDFLIVSRLIYKRKNKTKNVINKFQRRIGLNIADIKNTSEADGIIVHYVYAKLYKLYV